jgi:signal peptidase I
VIATRSGSGDRENDGRGTQRVAVLRPRFLALLAGFVLLVCLAGRLLFIRGWFRPVRISGGSMAETLVGRHLTVHCRDCRFPCRANADAPPRDGCLICPNCGQQNCDTDEITTRRGDRVLLDRLAYRWRLPRRWDLVAFRAADADDYFEVKRVVGLPGETVSIRYGDIYIDGRIQRKTLDQLRAMAILVYDADYQPVGVGRALSRRWRAESSPSSWVEGGAEEQFSAVPELTSHTDWLIYHHWRCIKGPWPRADEYAILDNYGYNQGVSRQLHRVSDVLLVCRARIWTGSGALRFSAHDGYAWFDISLSMDTREARLVCGQQILACAALPPLAYARGVTIEVATCDRQVLLAIEGRLVLRVPYEVGELPFQPTACPLRIGAEGVGLVVRHLQIFRDIHYLGPRGLGRTWTSSGPVQSGEIFVVGDNVPVSRDSRHWEQPGVARNRLLGRVHRVW